MEVAIYSNDNYTSLKDALNLGAVHYTTEFDFTYDEFYGVISGLSLACDCSFHNDNRYEIFVVINNEFFSYEMITSVLNKHDPLKVDAELLELLRKEKELQK